MPLFGSKKTQNMSMPEVVDFSNDSWSFKGEAPVYQIQSDGFSYDVVDSDGNDKNAISLGIAGMLVIVLNAKSPKIKEDELLPHFGKVIKTRNWHSMTVKEANFLVQTAIKKLTASATSGDVFDLASYAPLEIKRVLLKTLFTISRTQMKPEFREEAEHRIIDDIVPDIFANPEYELALLTGLIVKPDKQAEPVSSRLQTSAVLDPEIRYDQYSSSSAAEAPEPVPAEPDSAFAELQKIYGRKADAIKTANAAARAGESVSVSDMPASVSGVSMNNPAPEPKSFPQPAAPSFSTPQPNNPFAQAEPKNIPQPAAPSFNAPQPNNPFAQAEPKNISQAAAPNFGSQQPNAAYHFQQNAPVPQPPAPNFGPVPNNPFPNMNQPANPQMPNPGYAQMNPYPGNIPPYPGQMRQQNPQGMQVPPNQNMQQPYPGQMPPQNMGGYPQNFNIPPYPGQMMNRGQNAPQQPQQNDPTTASNA